MMGIPHMTETVEDDARADQIADLDAQIEGCLAELTAKQRAFVAHYLEHNNATGAYRHAYNVSKMQYRTIRSRAYEAARAPRVKEVIELHGRRTMLAAQITQEAIARRWWTIANTPITDVVRVIVPPCRHCYGIDHAFQWTTEREFEDARDRAINKLAAGLTDDARAEFVAGVIEGGISDPSIPVSDGGFGYNVTQDPNTDCPECHGTGGGQRVEVRDTDTLSPEARLILQGIKQTQHGVEITFADRAKALENLAKYLGMFAGKVAPDEINPLEQLARRLMGEATTVPVVPDEDLPHDRLYSDSYDEPSEVGFVSFAPDTGEDDEYVEP